MGPVFLTEFTTALAFYSYFATPLVPIQRLGFMAGHGTMIMFIFSMTLTPAALTFFPDKRKVKTDYNKPHAYFRAIGNYMLGRPRTVVLVWAALALGAAGFTRFVHVDSDPVNYFSPSYWFRQSVDFIEKQGSGAAVYEIVVRGDGPGSIKTAAYMRELDRLDRYLREEAPGGLVATMSISSVVRKINTALHGDDPAYDAIPGDDAAVSQYLFLYGLSVPVGQDLNDRINVDASATRLTAVRHLVSTQTSRQNIDIITNWAQAHLHNVTVEFTGRDVLYTNMGNNITKGLVDSFSLALFSIMIVMFLTFRSFKCAIVGLIVNVVPLLLTLGLMGVFRITLDVGTIMVADLGLGIAVDDTIHFLSHYRRQMRKGSTARAAILEMFGQLGTPLFVTTTVLVGSFMVFVFADFMPNFYFGVLISALIVIALLVELSLTPAMLYLWDRKRGEVETVTEPALAWRGHTPAPALGSGIECARD
jgi:predicted RND superfamily exporter protein